MITRQSLLTLSAATLLAISSLGGCTQTQNSSTPEGSSTPAAADAPKTTETLKMATSADYPPYEYRDTASGKDEIIGFDIDVANAIGKELGFKLEVRDTDFNGLIPALQSNRVDFVMAGMTPTEERKKNVDFSEIYYEAKNTIITKKGTNYTKLEDLAGKKVGVQLGSTQEKAVKDASKNIKDLTAVPLNKIPEIIQEIKSNRIEAGVIEDTVAKGYAENNPDLVFNTIPSSATEAGSAIAFPKDSKRVEDFNRVLKKLKDSGEIDQMAKKWFEKK